MKRWMIALILLGFPGALAAEASCEEIMQALRIPPPASGPIAGDSGLLGCSKPALEMFVYNRIAAKEAKPWSELSDLHGVWLGDDVLAYLSGVTVPGQEVLVIQDGTEDMPLKITQYWMKAVGPEGIALWSDTGDYLGLTTELLLEEPDSDTFFVDGFRGTVRHGGLQLEFERSYDLFVKQQINHFEMPFALRLLGDVLVLDAEQRVQPARELQKYTRSYTRIVPGAAELAIGTIAVMELSQSRNFDCLTHQIAERRGPLIDALGEMGIDGLQRHVTAMIRSNAEREKIMGEIQRARETGDVDLKDKANQDMLAWIERFRAFMESADNRAFIESVVPVSGSFCPDFF